MNVVQLQFVDIFATICLFISLKWAGKKTVMATTILTNIGNSWVSQFSKFYLNYFFTQLRNQLLFHLTGWPLSTPVHGRRTSTNV